MTLSKEENELHPKTVKLWIYFSNFIVWSWLDSGLFTIMLIPYEMHMGTLTVAAGWIGEERRGEERRGEEEEERRKKRGVFSEQRE